MHMWIMHVWIKVCLTDYDNQSNGVEGFQMRQKFFLRDSIKSIKYSEGFSLFVKSSI